MNNVNSSNEKILLAPIWYNPIMDKEHNAHNVFLSINVDKSKENEYIIGHFIDTLDDLEQCLYPGCILMTDDGLIESNNIKGIKFINTYNL